MSLLIEGNMTLPDSCFECKLTKPYRTKYGVGKTCLCGCGVVLQPLGELDCTSMRHRDCPLRYVDDELLGNMIDDYK